MLINLKLVALIVLMLPQEGNTQPQTRLHASKVARISSQEESEKKGLPGSGERSTSPIKRRLIKSTKTSMAHR